MARRKRVQDKLAGFKQAQHAGVLLLSRCSSSLAHASMPCRCITSHLANTRAGGAPDVEQQQQDASPSLQQLLESRRRLLHLRAQGDQQVSGVRLAAEAQEASHRAAEEQARQVRRHGSMHAVGVGRLQQTYSAVLLRAAALQDGLQSVAWTAGRAPTSPPRGQDAS